MTTQEVANRLVELVRTEDYETAHKELYHEDIISIENPTVTNEHMKYMESKGMEAKNKKSKEWGEDVQETHSLTVSDPLVAGPAFAINMTMDVTLKSMGRIKMEELAVYTVVDGKVVREEFIF